MAGREGEVLAEVKLGLNLRPAFVGFAGRPELGVMVWEVLRSWSISSEGRDHARVSGDCTDRHLLRVSAPSPGRPGRYEECVIAVSRYGGSRAWYARFEGPAEPPPAPPGTPGGTAQPAAREATPRPGPEAGDAG